MATSNNTLRAIQIGSTIAAPFTFGATGISAQLAAAELAKRAQEDAMATPGGPLPTPGPTAVPNTAAQQMQPGNVWMAIAQAAAQAGAARAASRPSLQSVARSDFMRRGGLQPSEMGTLMRESGPIFSPDMQADADRFYRAQSGALTTSVWDRILQAAAAGSAIYGAGQQAGWWGGPGSTPGGNK